MAKTEAPDSYFGWQRAQPYIKGEKTLPFTNDRQKTQVFITLLLFMSQLSSCGSEDMPKIGGGAGTLNDEDLVTDVGTLPEEEIAFDHLVIPPDEYYEALLAEEFARLHDYHGFSLTQQQQTQVLYVSFDGATIQRGTSRGQSFIPCQRQSEIPPSGISSGRQNEILDLVQTYFNEANARIHITGNRPAPNEDFTTIVVGGTYASLGCRGRGILGVAPYDVGNRNKNDIGFAFNNANHSNFLTATTIAHEAAHSFGLDHIDNRQGIMFPSLSNQIQGFRSGRVSRRARAQDSPALLRQNLGIADPDRNQTPDLRDDDGMASAPSNPPPSVPSPQPNLPNAPGGVGNLPGLDFIAALGQLLGSFNPSGPLDISNLLPQLDQILPGGLSNLNNIGGINGIDSVIAVITMAEQAAVNQSGGNAPNNQSSINDLITNFLDPATLASAGVTDIQSLLIVAGIQLISNGAGSNQNGRLLGALGGLFGFASSNGGQTNNALPQVVASRIPDFSEMLQLNTFEDHGELLSALEGHARLVNANFQGETRDAMLSMLRVAYAQASSDITR